MVQTNTDACGAPSRSTVDCPIRRRAYIRFAGSGSRRRCLIRSAFAPHRRICVTEAGQHDGRFQVQWSLFADWCDAADVESLSASPVTLAESLAEPRWRLGSASPGFRDQSCSSRGRPARTESSHRDPDRTGLGA
ncbi:hypothetical protein BJD99_01330 [Rhodococcus sp. 1163]|nr:hypothetical protein BJD99_01330 [Rhodococcus sp. 1163]